jgi:tetratricopeptide (TPR) repeat protein
MSGNLSLLARAIGNPYAGAIWSQFILAQWDEVTDTVATPGVSLAAHMIAFHRGTEHYSNSRFVDAVDAYREAIRLKPDFARAHNNLGCALTECGQYVASVDAFNQAIALQPDYVGAFFNKGLSFDRLGLAEEGIAAYDDLLDRFRAARAVSIRGFVAKALINKGFILGELGRREEEVEAYNDLLARFHTARAMPLRELVTNALFNKGIALGTLRRHEEEVAAYEDLLACVHATPELTLPERVANTLLNKGVALGELRRHNDAIAAYDDLVARFRDALELPLRERVIDALYNKGVARIALLQFPNAVAAYDELLTRVRAAPELPLPERVVSALANKSVALGALRRHEEAAVYNDLLAHIRSAPKAPLHELLAKIFVANGFTLNSLEQYPPGLAAVLGSDTKANIPFSSLLESIAATIKYGNSGSISIQPKYYAVVNIGDTTSTQARGTPEFRHALQPLPKGLTWPREDFDKAPEHGEMGGLKRYLERVWKDLIPFIDMPTLRERWPRLGQAIDRQRGKLPSVLLPPVKKQMTDWAAAAVQNRGDRPLRVERALRMRAYRARRKLRENNM